MAWEFTRRFAAADRVKVSVAESSGRVHAGSANNYPLTWPLGPTAPSTPWYVLLTDNAHQFRLLCFDFDVKRNGVLVPEWVEEAHDQCDALSALLTSLAIEHVVCESSATGGRHIWVTFAEAAPVDATKALGIAAHPVYPRLDHGMLFNAVTGGARPPLSPHRDGSFSRVLTGQLSRLLSPSTTLEQLQQLTRRLQELTPAVVPQNSVPTGPIDPVHRPHRKMNAWGEKHMATIGGGADPSHTGFMCVLAAVDAGWSLNDVKRAAQTAPGMETYRTRTYLPGRRRPRSKAEAAKRIETQWAKAQQIHAIRQYVPPIEQPAQDLTELQQIVTTTEGLLQAFTSSPGRWGNHLGRVSERAVMTALAYLTLQTGKPIVAAAVRDVALITGLSKTTIADALERLRDDQQVTRERTNSGANASEWSLADRFSTVSDITRPHHTHNTAPPGELFGTRRALLTQLEEELTASRHDLFTYQGLGHFAGKIYAHLSTHASTTVETLARQLGMSMRHTIASMSLLRVARLVIRAKDGWARAKRDLRRRAAERLGVLGILAARERRYQADRELWAWWQAEYATITAAPQSRPPRVHVSSRQLPGFERPGERLWPRYPRNADNLADHRAAREGVENGYLDPQSRFHYSDAA